MFEHDHFLRLSPVGAAASIKAWWGNRQFIDVVRSIIGVDVERFKLVLRTLRLDLTIDTLETV